MEEEQGLGDILGETDIDALSERINTEFSARDMFFSLKAIPAIPIPLGNDLAALLQNGVSNAIIKVAFMTADENKMRFSVYSRLAQAYGDQGQAYNDLYSAITEGESIGESLTRVIRHSEVVIAAMIDLREAIEKSKGVKSADG